MVDKLAAKDYVASRIGEEYIIQTLGVWDKVEDIDWDSLPDQFVLKTTHGGGGCGVVVCSDKTHFDKVELLNETYRDVMYYHFVCDMKIKDIADLLGEKPSAVQQKLIRGKKKLLEILDDDLRD